MERAVHARSSRSRRRQFCCSIRSDGVARSLSRINHNRNLGKGRARLEPGADSPEQNRAGLGDPPFRPRERSWGPQEEEAVLLYFGAAVEVRHWLLEGQDRRMDRFR